MAERGWTQADVAREPHKADPIRDLQTHRMDVSRHLKDEGAEPPPPCLADEVIESFAEVFGVEPNRLIQPIPKRGKSFGVAR